MEHAPDATATLTLPVIDDPDAEIITPPEVRAASRRYFLGLMGAVGVGLGLAFADALTNPFTKRVGAAAYTRWNDCRGYFSSSTTCVPTTAYYGTDTCDPAKWHKNATEVFILWAAYAHYHNTCNGHNAWTWTFSNGTRTSCSDGWTVLHDGVTVWLDSFSICRATI